MTVEQPHNRTSRLSIWPGMIFALIGLNVCIVGITVWASIVSRSPVEPDYYQRAVNWDRDREAWNASRMLGWSLHSRFLRTEPSGDVVLSLQVHDSGGTPIRSAQIAAEIFHEAHPTDVYSLSIVEQSPGTYVAPMPSADRGLWRLSVLAVASRSTFLAEQQIELSGSAVGVQGIDVTGGR
jgi:hypothetical protein